MPENIKEVYEILINLKADWSKTLGQQSAKFETFIKKANTTTQTLERSLSSMGKDIGRTYELMFKDSQTQLDNISKFARSALTGISSSSRKIMQEIQASTDRVAATIERNKGRIEKAQAIGARAQGGEKIDPALILEQQKIGERLQSEIDTAIREQDRRLTNMLGEHFNKLSEGVRQKTRAISRGTKQLIDDQLTQYERLGNLEGLLGKPTAAIKQAGGLKQLEQSQKAVYANLKQLAEAHKTAQLVYDRQVLMSKRATTDEQKQRFEELEFFARSNLENIQKEYLETAAKAEDFTIAIRKQKAALREKGPGIYESMREQLKPSRLKALFDPMFANLREQASLTGKNMTDALMQSLSKGDTLRDKLKAFRDRLADIKDQAAILSKMGIIDPNAIGPKINRAERMLKDFDATFKKMAQDMRSFKPDFSKFRVAELGDFSKTRKQIAGLADDFKKIKVVTADNFADTLKDYQKMEKLLDTAVTQRRAAKKKIIAIEREANNVEQQMAQVHDAQLREQMQRYINTLRVHASNLTKVLNRPIAFDRTNLKKWGDKFENEVRRTIQRVQASTRDVNLIPDKQLDEFKAKYKETIALVEKAANKRLFRTQSIEAAEKGTKNLTVQLKAYIARIKELEKELKRLEMMQKAGFKTQGIRQATRETRQYIEALKANVKEITAMHNHAQRRINDVQKVAGKGLLRSGWEMVRNFRWQVAAVIYLVQRAIWAVSSTIGDMFNQIANYRQQALALAAQFSFKMVGSTKDNFDELYSYTRTLLERLQLEAARTILTFEDMLMLTKTLAQAGIVPKTDEDIKKISTIGTAIKSLTEGMANAGVQMRQELYSIIAGRQRATDQLAMMFKVMGVNIQEMIDKGRAAGKQIHDILYEALEPFSILNQKMEDEYNAVKNRLQVIWQIIQRVGGEPVLEKFTQQLVRLADALYDTTSGRLTDLGRKIAAALNVALNILMSIGTAIKTFFSAWWEAASVMYSSFADIAAAIGLISDESKGINREWTAMKVISAGIQGIFITVGNVFKLIYMYIASVVTLSKVLVRTFIAIFKLVTSIFIPWDKIKIAAKWMVEHLPGAFKAVYDWVAGIFSKFTSFIGKILSWFGDKLKSTDAGADFVKAMENNTKDLIDINKIWDEGLGQIKGSYAGIGKSLKEIDDIQKGVNKNLELNLKEMLNLPYDYMKLMEEARGFGTDYGQMELKAKTGEERIEAQFNQRINKWRSFEDKVRANLKRFAEYFDSEAAKNLTEKQMQALKMVEKGHKDVLARILQYYKWTEEAKANELEKFNIKMAKQKRTYEQFMREALMVPETPEEKAFAWMEKMKIDLKALALENKYFKDNYDEVLAAIEKGGQIRQTNAIKEMDLAYESWINKASKADAWNNVFDKLNIEFDRYVVQIEKANNLDDDRKKKLKDQLDIIKEQRSVQERLNIAHEAYLAQQDLMAKKADYMKGAYSPIKQREGEILSLKATHNREMENMRKKLEEFNLKWKKHGQWVAEADDNVKAIGASYEETMRQMTLATERELQKKQMPIWNDLVEASKGWADGFTDSLAEIVNGVDSVTASLQELQMTILKDVAKTIIKRTITDNLMDALGSGFSMGGEGSPLGKLFGFGKEEGAEKSGATEITASKPIPVKVVNAAELMSGTAAITSAGSGGWMEGAKQIGGGMFDFFSGMGESGGAVATASTIRGGMGGGYGFADGGRITEPIIGRGLKSGEVYNFGEKTKYGEDEIVAPISKMQRTVAQHKVEYHMPIHLSAIDTQSGTQFLMKHSDTIQGQFAKSLKQNKPIRKGIQNAY